MSRLSSRWPLAPAVALLTLLIASPLIGGFSVDESPRETSADPGDIFFSGLVCDMDDGDTSCPPPSLNVPNPGPDNDPTFDMDALAVDAPLMVCPQEPPFIPGILFSFDDGDPGPGLAPPDNDTEMFLYDHCQALGSPRMSYYTSITEGNLGLGADPPPIEVDDDVDAYDTRPAGPLYADGFTILFSPDTPSTGGLPTLTPQAHVWFVNAFTSTTPSLWAEAGIDIGVPEPENCDIDGIARISEPDSEAVLLFTTDLDHDCGLDPGDIWATDTAGSYWLYADDVTDLKIAFNEDQPVDIDALAINDGGSFDPGQPYDPPEPEDTTFYKADWPNYAPSGMPDFSQHHVQWPTTLCGPTAVADSFWWFDSEMACEADRTLGHNAETEPNDSCDFADLLGEFPPISGTFNALGDRDWYSFEIPYHPYRVCRVTISTCALRTAGDDDTEIRLYDGCDGSGAPGTLIATNDDGCTDPMAKQSQIVVDLAGGQEYSVLVAQGPLTAGVGNYHLSLGIDCYPMVQRYPDAADDHWEQNPRPLIEELAWCMNTDDLQGLGSGHKGTQLTEMDVCIDHWLVNAGLDDRYRHVIAPMPTFDEIATEVEKSEDVVLLLGFWWQPPQATEWYRCGGHYVTSAGVDLDQGTITLSDPGLNNAETGAPGRIRGPLHGDHAPAVFPPPDHDDTENASHDRYRTGLPKVPSHALFSLPAYATTGAPTTCRDVAQWCMTGEVWGQNPPEIPAVEEACPDPTWPVSAEVEAMADVSPLQTPLCVFLDSSAIWPENLRMHKGACNPAFENPQKDVIRGKLCNLRFPPVAPGPTVDLGYVQCLYDDSNLTEFDELSPDDTRCMGGWFYLIRRSGDADYGVLPSGEARFPSSGDCP